MLGYALKEKEMFEARIDQLATLSETKLAALRSAMNALDTHVRDLQSAKQEYAACQAVAQKNTRPSRPPTVVPTTNDKRDICAGVTTCTFSAFGKGCC